VEVNAIDLLPIVIGHLVETGVAKDAGVVDDDVDAAELVERGLNNAFAVLDRVVAGDGLAAGGHNLVDDAVGGRLARPLAVHAAAEVIDDDAGSPRSKEQRVGSAQPAARAGDDGDPSV